VTQDRWPNEDAFEDAFENTARRRERRIGAARVLVGTVMLVRTI
jgi:hypothetical protein